MEADAFQESDFFAALARGGARVLLIGRRALIALGLPALTADYDLWLHVEDIELLNAALAPLDLVPTVPPAIARRWGQRDKDVADIRLLEGLKRQRGA